MSATTHVVPFHGDKLTLIDNDGQPFVAVRPICDRLGLAWPVQYRKLAAETDRWNVTIMVTLDAAGRGFQMVCIPVQKVFAWLLTISPSKVSEKARPVLERYQAECDRVLFEFWTGRLGSAAAYWKHRADAAIAELYVRKPIYGRLAILVQGGHDFEGIWRGTNYSRSKVADALRDMVQHGYLEALPKGTPPIEARLTRRGNDPHQSDLFGGAS